MAEIVSPDGDMRPCRTVKKGGLYWGGSAKLVQDAFGLSGDAFLYVGDHLYTDAALAKLNFQCGPLPSACSPAENAACRMLGVRMR